MFRAARRRAAKSSAGPLQERLHVGDQAGHRLLVEVWPEAPDQVPIPQFQVWQQPLDDVLGRMRSREIVSARPRHASGIARAPRHKMTALDKLVADEEPITKSEDRGPISVRPERNMAPADGDLVGDEPSVGFPCPLVGG